MKTHPLGDELQTIHDAYQRQFGEIEARKEQLESDIAELRFQMSELQARQALRGTEYDSLKKEGEELQVACKLDKLQMLRQTLEACQKGVYSADEFLSRLRQINEQRETIFAREPDLRQVLSDYREFESIPEAALKTMPAFHVKKMKEAQEQLGQQLKQVLQLEADEKVLQHPEHITLQMLISRDIENTRFLWVLPIPSNEVSAMRPKIVDDTAKLLLNAISQLAQHEDWYVEALSPGIWSGYYALVMTALCESKEDLAEATRQQILAYYRETPLFEPVRLDVDAVEIDWDIVRDELGLRGEAVVDVPQIEEPSISPTISDPARSLFSDADLKAWERPVRVVAGSVWNVQARRLRTLCTRLISKGILEPRGIEIQQLTYGLPKHHLEPINHAIPTLLEKGLLVQVAVDQLESSFVSLNPQMLTEIQSLINRDVTPVWLSIVQNEPNPKSSLLSEMTN